jgi:predicted sulfurtransferase
MPATVIEMPSTILTACFECRKPYSEEELSQCGTCGDRMCRHCSLCSCDVLALDMLNRAMRRLLTPRWTRLADFLSARIERARAA